MSNINLTFLGTASAQPSRTRNHSALALRLNGFVWLFDCGEGTQHQIQKSTVKMGKISKIFITHTHGDHIFGLLPLIASRLNGAGGMVDETLDPRASGVLDSEPLEIYGPPGTRIYVRTGLILTHTLLSGPYVVHELRSPNDPHDSMVSLPRQTAELPGRDIHQVNGTWPQIYKDASFSVSAAPILHSVPCVGYVIEEAHIPGKIDPKWYMPHLKRTGTPISVMRQLQQGETVELLDGTMLQGPAKRPGRKIVILGDTYDPSPIAKLAMHADVLIHEATNAHLPGIDPETKASDTDSTVENRSKSRGHSTPQMAALFASRINARKLVLNHFSSRYAGDYDSSTRHGDQRREAKEIMEAIQALAQSHFHGPVICARDFMTFDVQHGHSDK
ncbi:beta-lactamase-like protein [Multifurca ochricompacta]|uniref:Beta-lactamase-like protein n=1 Tax=Multifurca ochricompacta TaxID=376703 RepID=A0AAD4QSN9_9AGAM|nr:beta-lactamase-like protein [Multifurca ochricompacta]